MGWWGEQAETPHASPEALHSPKPRYSPAKGQCEGTLHTPMNCPTIKTMCSERALHSPNHMYSPTKVQCEGSLHSPMNGPPTRVKCTEGTLRSPLPRYSVAKGQCEDALHSPMHDPTVSVARLRIELSLGNTYVGVGVAYLQCLSPLSATIHG